MVGIVPQDDYAAQAPKLLKDFDRMGKMFGQVLARRPGGEPAEEIIQEARRGFQRLIPEIPYIGGRKNPLTRILVGCTMSLAFYRVLKRRGSSVEEIGRMVVEQV